MLPDLVSNPGPMTNESGVLPIALRGPASLHYDKKSQTDPLVFRTKFRELLYDFTNYETIFTDGDTVGSACVTPSDIYKGRLPDNGWLVVLSLTAL